MNEEITLDKLIKDGENIRSSMRAERIGSFIAANFQNPTFIQTGTKYHFNNHEEFSEWIELSKRYLLKHFPNDVAIDEFKAALIDLKNEELHKDSLNPLISILKTCKTIPVAIPPNDKQKQSDLNMNIYNTLSNNQTQNQNQSQIQSVDFLDILKDELKGSQYKEILQIVQESKGDIEKAKPRLLDKFKEFGAEVMCKILTKVITDPSVYSGLM